MDLEEQATLLASFIDFQNSWLLFLPALLAHIPTSSYVKWFQIAI